MMASLRCCGRLRGRGAVVASDGDADAGTATGRGTAVGYLYFTNAFVNCIKRSGFTVVIVLEFAIWEPIINIWGKEQRWYKSELKQGTAVEIVATANTNR